VAELRAPGLRADWLNAWLAAVGATVLLDGLRLAWTDDTVPSAILSLEGFSDVPEALADRMPTLADLDRLAIARVPRMIKVEKYDCLVPVARSRQDSSLAVTASDLVPAKDLRLEDGPFNTPAPHGETLFTRLRRCRTQFDESVPLPRQIEATLNQTGVRVDGNGLGFDYTRIGTKANPSDPRVDPILEVLAFYGTHLLPLRGNGKTEAARGWAAGPNERRNRFRWPIWSVPLDRWAIDSLLGQHYRAVPARRNLRPAIVKRDFETVPFDFTSNEMTRGYAAREVR